MDYKSIETKAQKSVALVAHDNMKASLIDWCNTYLDTLNNHQLFATGTTGARIAQTNWLSDNTIN